MHRLNELFVVNNTMRISYSWHGRKPKDPCDISQKIAKINKENVGNYILLLILKKCQTLCHLLAPPSTKTLNWALFQSWMTLSG